MYCVIQRGIQLFLRVYHRVEIEGLEHVPTRGPFLVVGNHISVLDPFYIAAVLPGQVSFHGQGGILFPSGEPVVFRTGGRLSRKSRGSGHTLPPDCPGSVEGWEKRGAISRRRPERVGSADRG